MAHSHNKHRMAHAFGHEPSYCLFSCECSLAVFGEENKSKSSIICMFYIKSMGTDARMVNNMEALGLVYQITVALPLRDWQMMLRLVRSSCRVCVVVAIPCRRRAGWALK